MRSLDIKVIPYEDGYKHQEGNSAAHVKASLMGCSQHVIIKDSRLLLGVWQGIYFTEFDGGVEKCGLIDVNVPAGV